jgi:cyclohexa-1,5-dienecarbonyl-CoA hydratase
MSTVPAERAVCAAPARAWLERDGKLLRLRLAQPKANILNAAMVDALADGLDKHAANPNVAGILIDAEGPHFSFGASVEEHLPDQCAAMLKVFHALILRLIVSPVPALVAVRGQCLGGGLELACAGGLLFVAPDAKLGQPEIQLGVFAPAASCLLPERVGPARAEDLLLSGRSIAGEEAVRWGLANAVADEPEAAALAYFDAHLAGKSASSLRFAARAARAGLADRVRAGLAALERLYLGELMASRDAVEGLQAFLAKRPARWENR